MDANVSTFVVGVGASLVVIYLFRQQIGAFIGNAQRFSWRGFTIETKKSSTSKTSKEKSVHGVTFVEAGAGRGEAFVAARQRAKKHIIIMGIGMGGLTQTALSNLQSQAEKVNIDLLMIDPEYLKRYPEFSRQMDVFFGKNDLAGSAQRSFDALRILCKDWNSNSNHIYKFRLRLYSTVPSLTMVLIDPEESKGEILFESFLPCSGQRTRFRVDKRKESELFEWFRADLIELWQRSRDGLQ